MIAHSGRLATPAKEAQTATMRDRPIPACDVSLLDPQRNATSRNQTSSFGAVSGFQKTSL